jgi:hypothetical protein
MTTGMRVRSFVAIAAILVGMAVVPHSAHASPKGDIQTKIKEAMENYDLMDYEAAKKLLQQALAIAKKNKLEKDPLTAKAYLDLGIVSFVNQDPDGAKLNFLSAIQIDPKIQIEAAYKSAEMSKLLESVRTEASGGGEPKGGEPKGGEPPTAPSVDCTTVQGLQHEIIDEAKGGATVQIEALVGADVTSQKVAVMYRPEGATEFTEVKLKKEGDCKYTGAIPSSAMKGSLVHYYVAAFNEVNKPVASKGSSGSPNIIEISGVAAVGPSDNEDPINGATGGGGGGAAASVSSGVDVGPKKARVLIAVTGGTGFGYVTGETEGMNTVKNCCIGNSLVVLQPEIGYFIKPTMSISVAGRIGLPLGANVEGHATAAPGGVVRVRFSLSPDGQGLRVMGQVGGGIMRNTIKLDNSMPGMDTDVVAQGPLLVGGGIGFSKRLGGSVSFIADLSALAGIAVVDHLGSAPKLNNGFGADLSIGLQLGL